MNNSHYEWISFRQPETLQLRAVFAGHIHRVTTRKYCRTGTAHSGQCVQDQASPSGRHLVMQPGADSRGHLTAEL